VSARQEDFVFAEHVLRRGFATEEQVQECLDLLERLRGEMSLEETLEGILLKRGYIAPAQAQVIRQAINPEAAGRSRNQIEGYRLLARLGSGAMGSVYKARHDKLDILVALKVLRVELAKSKTQVARLNQPNIVRSLDVGESNGFHYFAMEFVDGPTARNLIREGRLKEKDALRIVTAVARALEHAHGAGIIHRDVKPANIMLSKSGQVKLGDFGLARGQGPSELTLEHAAIGTPQYLAPEQAASAANATPRSDLFSLGATLYHLVTGQPPFSGDSLAEIFGRVIRADFEPPEAVVDDLSIDTVYLIHRLMRPNPKNRYASASELLADLEKLERGERIAPADFKGDYQSFLDRRRRKRAGIAAAAIAVIVVSAWFTASTIARHRAEEERLATCRTLNVRGAGELDALATIDGLRKKRGELGSALAEGASCNPETVRDLDRRVESLDAAIDQVERAERLLAAARESTADYRQLASQADSIHPALSGAAKRVKYVRAEIGRLSEEAAEERYTEVYVAHDDVPQAVADLKEFAAELKTRFLPNQRRIREVSTHARDLENLKQAYDRARAEHGDRFDDAIEAEDFDSAMRYVELIENAWGGALSRYRELPAIFLANFPHEDRERRDTLQTAERTAWLAARDEADRKDRAGRPDQAHEIVRKFLSGAENYRKTAEQRLRQLKERTQALQEAQLRDVAQIEEAFRNALGERRYGAAVALVARRKADYAWFGDGAQRFATMERRAEAIENSLLDKLLPRLRSMQSVPVVGITQNEKRKTAPGSAIEVAPDADRYRLRVGDESYAFTLRQLEYETLAEAFRVKTAKTVDERLAAGYFLIAESFGHRDDPIAARDKLDIAAKRLDGTGDPWLVGVNDERKKLNERIRKGEERAQELLLQMQEAASHNDHEQALILCKQLLEYYAWTETVRKAKFLPGKLRDLEDLAGAFLFRKLRGIPPEQFETEASGLTTIRYTGAPFHPLADQVPGGVDRETWLRPREEKFYKAIRGNPDAPGFDAYFHRAIHQLLDWSGPVDVVHPATGKMLETPGYMLQVKDPTQPDRKWWQKTLDEDELTIRLENHFDPEKDWSIELTVEWVESLWFEKVIEGGRVVATEHRARVPVYFAVACGKAQGAIGYFPKKNGGVAGTRVFLDERMMPEDAHEDELGEFHWHMANDPRRKKIGTSDRAWLDSRTWKTGVPYRVRFARAGHELHFWMAPLADWKAQGPFVREKDPEAGEEERTPDDWKRGKVENYKGAVHVWLKSNARVLDDAVDYPEKGGPKFRFFDRVRFTLRDVEVTGILRDRDGGP